MPKTVKYIGTVQRWSELASTGRQSVWSPGQMEERSDTEAAQLLSTGMFTANIFPLRLPSSGDDSIMAIGDSITRNGNDDPTSTTDFILTGQSYLAWACMLSLGKLKFGGVAATGGYNTSQIITSHLPTIVAARPRFCVVAAGTNDYGTLTLAQTIANLTTIYTTLLSNGITPIATTLLPKQTLIGSSSYVIQRLNVWIASASRQLSIPLVDWNILLSTPADGNWIGYGVPGTYNQDSTHPNEAGARVMGQAILDGMVSYGLLQRTGYLPRVNVNTTLTAFQPTNINACMLLDTNADGTADGFNKGGTGTLSISAMTGNEGVGSWQDILATSAAAVYAYGGNTAIVPGNKMLFVCRFKSSSIVSSGGLFDLRFTDSNTVDIFALRAIKQDVSNGVLYHEFTIPAGASTLFARPYFSVQGTNAKLSVGQVGVIDLTAAGLA